MNRRPVGITVMAVLCWVSVAMYVVLGALAVFSLETLQSFLRALSPSGVGPEAVHNAMGRLLPLYYLLMAGLSLAMALGFWRLWNWTRLVTLGMIGLSLLGMLAELPGLLKAPTAGAIALTLFRVGLSAMWAWYLMRRSVREAFRPPVTSGDTPATLSWGAR